MASDEEKREKLVDFLDKKAFEPVLQAREDDYPADQRDMLRDVKQSTESERRRVHQNYRSAEEVRDNYLSDLTSRTGKEISRELHELDLPALPDLKEEFLELCEQLDVKSAVA